MKRFYTLLILLVAFVSSMIAADITLYYVNSTGWSNVYAYVWDDATQTDITSYPGKKATKTTLKHNGYFIYSFTFDSSKADRIIFNNGGTTTSDKTYDLVVNASKPYFYDGIWYKDNTFKSKYTATLYKVVDELCDVSIPSVICLYKSEEDAGNQLVGYVKSNTVEPSMTINNRPVHKIVVPFDEPVYVGVRYRNGQYYGSHKELIASNITLYSNSYEAYSWFKSLDEARYGVHFADLNQQPEAGKIYLIAASSPKVYSSKYGTSSSYYPSGTSYKETINGENYYSYEIDANLYDKVIISNQEYSINWSKPYFYNGQWYAKLNEIPINNTLVEYCSNWLTYDFSNNLICLGNNIFKEEGDHSEKIKLNNEDITYSFKYCDKKISKTLKAPVQSGLYNVVVTLNANTEEITAEWELKSTGVKVQLYNGFGSTLMDLVGENLHTYAYSKLFEPGLYYYTITDEYNSVTKKDVVFEIPEKGKYDLIWTYNATTGKVDLEIKKVVSEVTLYYVNNTAWTTVKAYVWDYATGTPINAWPGEAATKLDKTVDGYDVYSYTFDYSQADRILFNNGSSNLTTDLAFDASKPYFYNGVWYETLTFDTNGGGTVDPTPEPEPEPDPVPNPDVAPLYVKGGFNNWEANDTYKLTSADGNYYVANYSAGNEITISGNFKISNEDWSVNYGGGFLIEAGKSYMLVSNAENLDTAGKIKVSKVEFTLSTAVLKITGTTSSNEFDITTDQGVAFVVNPRGASPVYVPLTHSYNAEYNTAQYTGTYTVTELGFSAKIGGLTNFNVIDYGTNGQTVKPAYIYDMVKGAYDGFTIEGDYKVGDVLNIFVVFDSDWYASIIINVQAGGTTPTPDPTPTPGGEVTLYYVNNTAWAAVKAYVWDYASDVALGAWPGAPATKTGKTVDGYDVYSYTFDSSVADRIIFNNGGAGNQTSDLVVDTSKPYFYNGVWYETLTFDATGSDEGSDEGGNEGGEAGGEEGGDDTGDVEIGEPTNLYIIGALTGWVADATWQFSTADEEYFVLSFPKGQEQELSGQFKVASSNWSPYNFGAPKDLGSVEAGKEYVLEYNVATNLSITNIIKVSKIEFTLSTQTLKITGATEEKVFDTTSDYGFYLYADYEDYPFTFKGNGVYEYDYTGVGPSSTIGDYQYKTVEWGRNSTGNEVTLGELYQLDLSNHPISFPDAAIGQTLTIVLTVSSDWSATILVKEKSSEEGGDEGGNEGGEEGGGDTPVVPGPTPEPEPEPEPVVAIRELTLQPFERILPKTSTSTVATFILENASTATVSLEGNDADFFEIGEQNIAEGECSVQLVFNPFVKGVYYATLTVTTDDNVSLSIDFAAVCGDETFEPGDVPELNPDPVNPDPVNPDTPANPDDDTNVSVEEVSAVVIYANEGTIYSEVDFEIYDLAGVNVTSLNGALKGVYVVKTTEGNRLISVW